MAKLNIQGLARRDKKLMENILAESGTTLVSIDLGSGEPTVTSHFSKDKNYRYACFEGVGKAPYWDKGVLMIDDIYIMVMSVSPVGKDRIREVWNMKFDGKTFVEQWLEDAEVIKDFLKNERALHKMLALALGYGMGAKKMVKQCYDNGYIMTLETAKEFRRVYWALFPQVAAFARALSKRVAKKGWIVNPFGYRLVPEKHKAFNYFIQSSVSGIMHLFGYYLFQCAPWARFVTCIHDEFLVEVPDERLEEFREMKEAATRMLNEKLNWSVNIRTGFEIGKDWYAAK